MGMMYGPMRSPGKPITRETVTRIARLFLPYKAAVIWTAAAVLGSAGLGLLPPLYLRLIVNRGLLGHNLHVVTLFTLYTLAATIGTTALSLGYGYLSVVVGQRIMRDMRDRLYDHLQGMSLRFFTNTRTGEIQSRLVSDVGGVQSVVSDTAASVLSNVTTVLSTLVVMVYMDWRLTLLSVGILPVFAVIGARVGGYARSVRGNVQSQLAALNATMQETLSVSGMLLSKTSGRRRTAQSHFAVENEALTRSQVQMAMIMRGFFNLIGLTFSITPALVYWLAGYLIVHGSGALSLGTIVAFTALQSRLFFPLTNLLNTQVDVTSAVALFDRIFEYLDLKQDIVDAPDAVSVDAAKARGDVSFEHVTFRYSDDQDEPTLADISFEARPGSLVALVGHSGAGKTTLTYLIPRLYDVESGSVRVDGVDVRQLRQDSLAGLIGVVTQETYLVHDTVSENLRYGKPDATREELEAAARAAAIHDHIMTLPEQYDTVVGERGYKLSGGEKQRIAIARAILKNPRILILDEATSALDTQSERLIQNALAGLMEGRTTFAIAHRLSTILAADLILVMEAGRVIERGTHAELIERRGAYAALYAVQFEDP
ncbi:MAG: ABC transporter ATP-binding protein [Armatimonadetes bacterium]|nr:ABC transporter ATP-binding protein [Armatimonadota bacterium]MDE2207857.1 ABC transporter ATP-binding protein [Armatimonadota bacterium]